MLGIELAVGAFEPGVGDHPRTAVARPADVDHVQVVFFDQPVAMGVNEVQAGRGAPVPQQPGLDVLEAQRLGQQRVVVEINLPNREIIRRAPVGVDLAQFFVWKAARLLSLHFAVHVAVHCVRR